MAKPARSPDIAELRAFCLAANLGSLGRAAVALRTSQPAVSKRIRQLEAAAGAQLLERSSSGVALTEAGKRLYPDARSLLDQADAVAELLGQLGGGEGPLRVAVSHTVAEFHLSPELVAYQTSESRPRALELTVGNSQAVRRMVADGRADIGVAGNRLPDDPDDRLEELELLEDEVVLAVPEVHPWYRRETVPREQFLRTPLIVRDPGAHSRRLVDAVLASYREHLAAPLLEVGSTAAAKREALELGAPILLSALALDEKRDRLHRRRIESRRFPRRFLVIARSRADLSPSERDFVDFLRRRYLDVVPAPPPDGGSGR
ncbi:MAG TPA: LysR family transcriptional regulator [Solirubrobacterales bacterium]|nr:LysR family transcriptional regulator [Solirubrobacterales bacterium]